jgi:hypothetical protein
MATLLSICQDAIRGVQSTDVPTTIAASTSNPDAVLLKSCASDVGRALERGYKWQALKREYTFATVNGTADYDFPTGIRRFADLTIWDRSGARPLVKASDITFQALKSGIYVSGVRWFFTVSDNQINLSPTPTAAYTFAFNYYTKQFCETSGGSGLDDWADDSDVPRLDDNLMTLGIRYRYLARQGLPYGEEKGEYLEAIRDLLADDRPHPVIDVGRTPRDECPVNVPDGSWGI